jgi:hypothetical protein
MLEYVHELSLKPISVLKPSSWKKVVFKIYKGKDLYTDDLKSRIRKRKSSGYTTVPKVNFYRLKQLYQEIILFYKKKIK